VETKAACDKLLKNPAQWLIVSKVTFVEEGPEVVVEKADGHVCPRCWNMTETTNEDGLCDRCFSVMQMIRNR
jgi:isoleucyl-tRNA synthetase